jgi:pentatricopeptide repeat protein
VRLITAVWGQKFVDLFLNVTLRSLISKGNLFSICTQTKVSYSLITTENDAGTIAADPVFKAVAEKIVIDFTYIDDFDKTIASSHWKLWEFGLEKAKSDKELAIFIFPDGVYSEGTLETWYHALKCGKRSIYAPGLQVATETALDEICSEVYKFNIQSTVHDSSQTLVGLGLNSAQLQEILCRHFHPYMISMFDGSPRRSLAHPEMTISRFSSGNLIASIFASHPVAVNFNYGEFEFAYNPIANEKSEIFFDVCRFVCLERVNKYFTIYIKNNIATDFYDLNSSEWRNIFCTKANTLETMHFYYIGANRPSLSEILSHKKIAISKLRRQIEGQAIINFTKSLDDLGHVLFSKLIKFYLYSVHDQMRIRLRKIRSLRVPENAEIMKCISACEEISDLVKRNKYLSAFLLSLVNVADDDLAQTSKSVNDIAIYKTAVKTRIHHFDKISLTARRTRKFKKIKNRNIFLGKLKRMAKSSFSKLNVVRGFQGQPTYRVDHFEADDISNKADNLNNTIGLFEMINHFNANKPNAEQHSLTEILIKKISNLADDDALVAAAAESNLLKNHSKLQLELGYFFADKGHVRKSIDAFVASYEASASKKAHVAALAMREAISSCCKNGDFDRALSLLSLVETEGVPTLASYFEIAKLGYLQGKVKLAFSLVPAQHYFDPKLYAETEIQYGL